MQFWVEAAFFFVVGVLAHQRALENSDLTGLQQQRPVLVRALLVARPSIPATAPEPPRARQALLTTVTSGASAWSGAVNSRPSSTGTPCVRKAYEVVPRFRTVGYSESP